MRVGRELGICWMSFLLLVLLLLVVDVSLPISFLLLVYGVLWKVGWMYGKDWVILLVQEDIRVI